MTTASARWPWTCWRWPARAWMNGTGTWLAYAEYVLDSGRTGADRLLALWTATAGGVQEKLRHICAWRSLRLGDE